MKRILSMLVFLTLSCTPNSEATKKFKDFKSNEYKEAVYEVFDQSKKTVTYDTLKISMKESGFIIYKDFLFKKNEIESIYLYEIGKKENYRVHLYYETESDSILVQDTIKLEPHKTASYRIGNNNYTVRRQLDCYFCKTKPNVFEYSTAEFGLILRFENNKKLRLKKFLDEKENNNLDSLISLVQKDKSFCNQK